jgi:hypothetical protein
VQMVGLIDEKKDSNTRDMGAQDYAVCQALDPFCMVSGGWRAKITRWLVEKQMPKGTLRTNKSASSYRAKASRAINRCVRGTSHFGQGFRRDNRQCP